MTVERGFPVGEFEDRVMRAQHLMANHGLSALLLTTEPEIRYYSGFLTRFWESPTRPWFLVLPAAGRPIAVIPEIGAHLMAQTWLEDIRTWPAPDYGDDGVDLLAATLRDLTEEDAWVGLAENRESHVRMPRASIRALKARLGTRALVGDASITQQLRNVKSPREVAKIETAVKIADRAFARVPECASTGLPLERVFRDFQRLCLEEGADWVLYLAGAAGPNGYGDVISPATDTPLTPGDVLMLDTGLVWDGYFCDFDRNFAVGTPTPETQSAHARLIDAVQAGYEAARPGACICDLYHVMSKTLGTNKPAGRMGHGLGMQLTEGPSILPADTTLLEAGMVLTLEPSISVSPGTLMVHEENIVICDNGPHWLSDPQHRDMRVLA